MNHTFFLKLSYIQIEFRFKKFNFHLYMRIELGLFVQTDFSLNKYSFYTTQDRNL